MADPLVPAVQAVNVALPQRDPNSGGGSTGPVPVLTPGMTFREYGNSGLRAWAGWVREEFLPQLQGRQAQTVYREMSDNNPVIGGLVSSIKFTMQKVEWREVPADDSPAAAEAAEFVSSLREDMGATWNETLSEALSMIQFGFAPLEIVYKKRLGRNPGADPRRPGKSLPKSKYDDGNIGWAKLPIRGQDTVIKWFFDENGDILGLTQQPWTGPLLDIPAEKFMLFRPSAHKNNPEGRSVLRNCYRPYFMNKRLEEQEAILAERLNGIPVVSVPSALMEASKNDPSAKALIETLKAIAVNLRVDEQMGVVLPSDVYMGGDGNPSSIRQYSIELVSPGGGKGSGGTNTNEVINRNNSLMLMSTLADFLTLGHGKTGTQALAVSKTDMFFQGVEGWLNSVAAEFQTGVERIWDLNGFDYDLMPHIEPDLAQRVDLDVLSNFVLRLAQSGMALFPNKDLETALLDAAGLPDIADPAAGSLIPDDEKPQAIVGPAAAAAQAALMPEPAPVAPGSPQDQFRKMVNASIARRVLRQQGNTRDLAKRHRMPPIGSGRQMALFE